MIDAVLSYHLNPNTCGVARFNKILAERLGVPLMHVRARTPLTRRPLISIKTAEWSDWWCGQNDLNSFELFFHDIPDLDNQFRAKPVTDAWLVYAADPMIAAALRPYRSDVITAFCPSTVAGNAARGAFNVLVFGMAHKLVLPHFQKLKAQLDAEHPDYTVSLSTAVHEGSPWDTALTESVTAMRGIFGDQLRVLGYLGDDALAKELQDCDAVAAYFTPALRANNTSAWAALEAGKPLYTNTDEYSPALDAKAHSWEKLLEIVRA